MKILKITHSSGFFSCCSKRLEGIIWFFNKYKSLPDKVDSSEQFYSYKSNNSDDLTNLYFAEKNLNIKYNSTIDFHNDMQFADYKKLNFKKLQPFIEKYFFPSKYVEDIVTTYEKKYTIDYNNTCAVFYRGNDKATETKIAKYENFITKAKEIKKQNTSINFLIQTDEVEFLEVFFKEFPDSIVIEELPRINKKNSAVLFELPIEKRAKFGADFFGALIVVSKCKHIITHSGNCGLWCILYRGNCDNVYQYLNNSWEPNNVTIFNIWQKNKRYIKKILKKSSDWMVISS